MNTLNKLLMIAALGAVATGCNDLDTAPLGNIVTTTQKQEVLEADPSMAEASTTAIPTSLNLFGSVLGTSQHLDFGYPAIMLGLDSRSADMPSDVTGYNWFSEDVDYTDNDNTSRITRMTWGVMYKCIYAANEVCASIGAEPNNPQLKYYLAQALGYRAHSYFVLAQLYQFTYVGNESKPCVPLITNENSEDAATNGCPRATVEEVYTQILADLNRAVELLEETGNVRASSRMDKKFFNASIAHGLRARVNLVMHRWNEAAADAQYAITNSGAQPYSREAVSVPTFWDAADNSWLWAVVVEESDRVVTTGICNWPSMACSFSSNGYVSVGAWRYGNKAMIEALADSDVRKGWWTDATGKSPNLSQAQQAYMNTTVTAPSSPAYINVKFDVYKGNFSSPVNANDIPLMRIEEMYLILAEAQAMSGNAGQGAQTLTQLISGYRDPAYKCTESSPEGVQNAVHFQRRVELWGEGMAYFDIMRLNKGIDRRGGGYEPATVFNIPAGDPILILRIPQTEVEGNKALGENNPEGKTPSPVTDL